MNNIFVVSLTNSDQLCLINSEDIESVLQFKWFLSSDGYIVATHNRDLYLHKFILAYHKEKHIHHKNELRWDNRRNNLQIISVSLHRHIHGRHRNKNNFRWVYFDKRRNNFYIKI